MNGPVYYENIKVLMLNYEFPPLGGGAGNANYYLLKEFSNQAGITVDLVTSSTGSGRTEQFADNITVHYLDIGKRNENLHYQSGKDILSYAYNAFRYARRLQRDNYYNLCHAYFGIPCGFIAMLLGLPYIVSLRGSDVPFYNSRFYWLDGLLFKRLSKFIWKRAAGVVANSDGLKQMAMKTAPELDVKVICNGVDTKQFYPFQNKLNGDKLKLISTGRLIERKGYRYLIEALKGNNRVELILVGEGNLTEELKNLAAENKVAVNFTGRIDHEHLPHYLNGADLFVLPSLNEGMANSLLEAMACGLPVIVTDTGGAKELVQGNGFVVARGSSEGLRNAIEKYINNDKLIVEQGEKSREIATKNSWSEIARHYRTLYNDCS